MVLFFGILHTNSIIIAYVLGFLAGTADSFLDVDTYPSLMGASPRSPGTANILVKAFVSSGQLLLPLIINLLVQAELWFGWSFMITADIVPINALFLYLCMFPPHPGHRLPVIEKITSSTEYRCLIVDLTSYTLYSYISVATFCPVSQWLAQYGQFVAGMLYTMSIKLLSIYTVGSPLCVFITVPLIRNTVHPATLLMLYTFIPFIALFTICLHPTFYVMVIFIFIIGFTSAGGVVQIDLTLMTECFPYAKGKATGIYYNAGSTATSTIPLITARLSQRGIADIMWFNTAIVAIGSLLALFIGLRSRKEMRRRLLEENVVPDGQRNILFRSCKILRINNSFCTN